jgi:hypothetical protein
LIGGIVVFSVVYGGLAFARSAMMIYALFFVYGIYAASTESISKAWITNISRKEDAATAIGLYTGLNSIVVLLASTAAGLIWYFVHPSVMFMASSVGAMIVARYFLFYVRYDVPEHAIG